MDDVGLMNSPVTLDPQELRSRHALVRSQLLQLISGAFCPRLPVSSMATVLAGIACRKRLGWFPRCRN